MPIIFKHPLGKPSQHLYGIRWWSVRLNCSDCGLEETTQMWTYEERLGEEAARFLCKECRQDAITHARSKENDL